ELVGAVEFDAVLRQRRSDLRLVRAGDGVYALRIGNQPAVLRRVDENVGGDIPIQYLQIEHHQFRAVGGLLELEPVLPGLQRLRLALAGRDEIGTVVRRAEYRRAERNGLRLLPGVVRLRLDDHLFLLAGQGPQRDAERGGEAVDLPFEFEQRQGARIVGAKDESEVGIGLMQPLRGEDALPPPQADDECRLAAQRIRVPRGDAEAVERAGPAARQVERQRDHAGGDGDG